MLAKQPAAPAVTIYMPTHRQASPPNMSEDEIRFKNIYTKAIEILKTREDSKDFLVSFDQLTKEILSNQDFWKQQTEGLLLCARPNELKMFHLPFDTQEYLAVADQFHLAPIFGLLNDFKDFYLLLLGQHSPQIYKGSTYSLSGPLIELPATLEDALKIDEMDQENEQQVSSYSNGGGYNGRGGSKNPAEEERHRFWRIIDDEINRRLPDRNLPLILAGTESEISEFRAISRYQTILTKHLEGSYATTKANDLLKPANDIIQSELIQPEHERLIEQFKMLAGKSPDMIGTDIATITQASNEGRIDKLLLSGIRNTTDTVRDNLQPVPLLSMPSPESAQAVNEIARIVYDSSGQIINIEASRMPIPGSDMLAIMRY